MSFSGLLPAFKQRIKPTREATVYVRDSLQLSTWLCIGATLQSAAFLLFGRMALAPAACFLLFRAVETYAIATGLKHNSLMDGVLMEKFSAQFPDAQGDYGSTPSNNDVSVVLIGTRSNHPMGLLAPGFKDLGNHFSTMTKFLEDNAVEHGFLGSNGYIGAGRSSNNTFLSVMYFKNSDYVHMFADTQSHRDGLNWWNKVVATHPHLSIFHELYQIPRGYWESVYVQVPPVGAAATMHNVPQKDGEDEKWMSPVVDARKGVLRTSAGRMGRNL